MRGALGFKPNASRTTGDDTVLVLYKTSPKVGQKVGL
jgi:hypothetical protein